MNKVGIRQIVMNYFGSILKGCEHPLAALFYMAGVSLETKRRIVTIVNGNN